MSFSIVLKRHFFVFKMAYNKFLSSHYKMYDKIEEGFWMANYQQRKYTVAGTDIDEVKRQNAQSGMSYNEVKRTIENNESIDTASFSNTNIEQVRKDIQQNTNTL